MQLPICVGGVAMVKEEMVPASTLAPPNMEELMKDVHGAIELALAHRRDYLFQNVTTFTLLSVRRLLEQDLCVEQGFLDPHKEYIKILINKLFQEPEAENPETEEAENPETEETEKEHDQSKEPELESSADQIPKMKRLKKKTESVEVKDEVMKSQGSDAGASSTEEGIKKPEVHSSPDAKEVDMESLISEAMRARVSYFKSQAQTLTVLGVRRLLEQDLSLEIGGLDAHKQHIRKVLDEVLNSGHEEPVPATTGKKRKAAASESKSISKKSSKKRNTASSEDMEENVSCEDERTSKKFSNRKSTKKRVVQEEDEDASGDNDDDEEPSKGDSSGIEDSDDEETERKKISKPKKVVESKPVYGKKVEHLKSTIKACGITVPPSVYKKAKQASEERREIVMIKELEAILSKEGLTASSSKDEIKVVRKRKEKLKDLEGIDTSNIIGESGGRRSRASSNSFFAPQRSKSIELDDEDEDEDEDEELESDSEGDPNVELQDDDDED